LSFPLATRVGIMLHATSDCGAAWQNSFVDIDGMARPGGGTFQLEQATTNIAGNTVLRARSPVNSDGSQSAVYGIDTTQIYSDPYTGKVFLSTGLAYPDPTKIVGALGTEVLLVSPDDTLASWSIAAELPQLGRPMVMTSAQVGARTKLFVAGDQSIDAGDGITATYPMIYWYDISGSSVVFEGAAPVPFQSTSPVAYVPYSQGTNIYGNEITGSRGISNLTISRGVADTTSMRVRVAYPHGDPGAFVPTISKPCTTTPLTYGCLGCVGAACARTLNLDVIGTAEPGGPTGVSAVFPHFIESDFVTWTPPPGDARADGAVLKYLIWGAGGGVVPHVRAYYGTSGVTSDVALRASPDSTTPWIGNACTTASNCDANAVTGANPACVNGRCTDFAGDYAWGAPFTRNGTPRYLVPWQAAASATDPRTFDNVLLEEVAW
jgi:hypothetical protein